MPTSEQNLKAVSQWVEGLSAEGSTNTMAALSQAMSVRGAQAIYLLTDGRPNQPESEVLGNVQKLPNIPVHTISFNCADSKANSFLAQLSKNTGGRYIKVQRFYNHSFNIIMSPTHLIMPPAHLYLYLFNYAPCTFICLIMPPAHLYLIMPHAHL